MFPRKFFSAVYFAAAYFAQATGIAPPTVNLQNAIFLSGLIDNESGLKGGM
jgi:hypothetical protein